ncbi:MAG TPA: 30S ribosomal protein S20 [Candidatus Kaiserbacteria bacterium]|nr:30S ribosomal protein S20 [Candidatus Kaiserbacteria bacterium]
MAITSSAKKAHKASLNKQVFNIRRKRELHDVMKDIASLISLKKGKDAQALLPKAYKAIDKAAKRGVIKKNTASRKKSRLSASIKKIS